MDVLSRQNTQICRSSCRNALFLDSPNSWEFPLVLQNSCRAKFTVVWLLTGYTGISCGECDTGYEKLSSGHCGISFRSLHKPSPDAEKRTGWPKYGANPIACRICTYYRNWGNLTGVRRSKCAIIIDSNFWSGFSDHRNFDRCICCHTTAPAKGVVRVHRHMAQPPRWLDSFAATKGVSRLERDVFNEGKAIIRAPQGAKGE